MMLDGNDAERGEGKMNIRQMVKKATSATELTSNMLDEYGTLDAPGRLEHAIRGCSCCHGMPQHPITNKRDRNRALDAFALLMDRRKAEILRYEREAKKLRREQYNDDPAQAPR